MATNKQAGMSTTTLEPQTTSGTPRTTRDTPQTTRDTSQAATSEAKPTTAKTQKLTRKPTTTLARNQTTKDSVSLTTLQPNVTSAPPEPSEQNVTERHNISELLEMSGRKELSPKSFRNMIEMLERSVYRRNYSDTETTKVLYVNIV